MQVQILNTDTSGAAGRRSRAVVRAKAGQDAQACNTVQFNYAHWLLRQHSELIQGTQSEQQLSVQQWLKKPTSSLYDELYLGLARRTAASWVVS